MGWFSNLRKGNLALPSNDTSTEEMEEMIFDDPEGDDYLMDDTGEDPAIDTDRTIDSPPSEEPKGFFTRFFGK